MKKIIVTGAAGFIGFHLSKLLVEDYEVIGIDNLNDYYSPELKQDRLNQLKDKKDFSFKKMEITDTESVRKLFDEVHPDYVVHLAAQAGVRYSLENPRAYIESNLIGYFNIMEACKDYQIEHLIYASSSSVYGGNKEVPFSVDHKVDYPVSLYAATKKSNELMAHTYSHLYGLPTTGLRFFTVYGPWGRPDMAYYKFAKKIIKNESIDVYNNGDMSRDFTYVGDIVESIRRLISKPPSCCNEKSETDAPYRVLNIGSHQPVQLLDFISILETKLDMEAVKVLKPMQAGDVKTTYADVSALYELIDYKPKTSLEDGLGAFVAWFKDYHQEEVGE